MKGITYLLVTVALLSIHMTAVSAMGDAPGDIAYQRIGGTDTESFPPAIFPHWRHRIHYRCDTCHDEIFKMEKGATIVTMERIGKGETCGTCHNGDLAFDSGFDNCHRCHDTTTN